jgi:hypothetical protein
MSEPPPPLLEDLSGFLLGMIDEHYPDHEQRFAGVLLDAHYIAAELGLLVSTRVEAWRNARETSAGTLADCVLLMLPHLHSQLCSSRPRADHCEVDVAFCASVITVLAMWQMETPFLSEVKPVIAGALAVNDTAVRRDRLEIGVRPLLAPAEVTRELPAIRPERINLQVNTAITRLDDDEYDRRRAFANHIRFALDSDSLAVEVTADWAHPADGSRPPLDDAVDGAIYRTTAMVVFTGGGGIGTGDTLRLAGDLLIPTLVLRYEGDETGRPLQARREGRHALRIERSFQNQHEVIQHVESFLDTYRVQIERRHQDLVSWAARADEVSWIRDAVDSLDPALFETANINEAAAIFIASHPVHWFQARSNAQTEVQRLISLDRSGSEQRPIPASTMSSTPKRSGSERALQAERTSMMSLLTAAEINNWSFALVSRLLSLHLRQQVRQNQSVSHFAPPMQQRDWERLQQESFGP